MLNKVGIFFAGRKLSLFGLHRNPLWNQEKRLRYCLLGVYAHWDLKAIPDRTSEGRCLPDTTHHKKQEVVVDQQLHVEAPMYIRQTNMLCPR